MQRWRHTAFAALLVLTIVAFCVSAKVFSLVGIALFGSHEVMQTSDAVFNAVARPVFRCILWVALPLVFTTALWIVAFFAKEKFTREVPFQLGPDTENE